MKRSGWMGWATTALVLFFSGRALGVELDLAVPADQARSIQNDLAVLGRLHYREGVAAQEIRKLLHIKGAVNGSSLSNWLSERVALIVSDEMDFEHSLVVAPGKAVYPEADRFPRLDTPKAKPESGPAPSDAPSKKPVIVMANLGSAFYLMAKQKGVLIGLRKTAGGVLPLVSPHGGFIQIGEGLFLKSFRVNPDGQDAPANSISRLSTFFHESRHSDGHGETLGFMHALCPEGHAYAGYPACDRNLNGPYTVGAQMLKTLAESCDECSVREKTILKMIEADSRSRILKSYIGKAGKPEAAKNWSDQYEKVRSYQKMQMEAQAL